MDISPLDRADWELPFYNPPDLLIGPILKIPTPCGRYMVPDWTRPGVRERLAVEHQFVEDHGIPDWRL